MVASLTEPVTPAPSLAARLRFVESFGRLLRRRHDDLVAVIGSELGKPAWEVTLTEVLPLLASLDWHRKHLRRLLAPRSIGGGAWWQRADRTWSMRAPVGRVLLIATWNYPVQLLGIQLLQSLAAGNETWVKPSERSPRSHELLLSLAQEAMASAVLSPSLLRSAPATRDAGEALVRTGRFDHILFTGSTQVGRAIARAAAETLTPTTLELSGQDSAIVLADADLRLAARTIWHAVTLNAGQTCMAPRRVLVARNAYRGFLDALAPLAAAASPVRLVDATAAQHVHAVALAAMHAGGRPLAGVVEAPKQATLRPIAIAECPVETGLFAGEHFGPALAITPVDDLNDAISLHASVGQALATSLFTRDADAVRERLAEFGSSFVTINDCVRPTAHPATSIAGRGPSGWGASRGEAGLIALTRPVTVTTRGRFSPPPETPSDSVLRWIRTLCGLRSS